MGRFFEEYPEDKPMGELIIPVKPQTPNLVGQCPEPDCSNILVYQEGCYHCPVCGYSRC